MGSSLLIYVLKSASSSISAREDWSVNKRQESIWEETDEDQISFSFLGLWTFYIEERIDPSVSSIHFDRSAWQPKFLYTASCGGESCFRIFILRLPRP